MKKKNELDDFHWYIYSSRNKSTSSGKQSHAGDKFFKKVKKAALVDCLFKIRI